MSKQSKPVEPEDLSVEALMLRQTRALENIRGTLNFLMVLFIVGLLLGILVLAAGS